MFALSSGRRSLGFVVAFLLAALLVVALVPSGANAQERYGRRRQMLSLTNEDRRQHDRRALDFAGQISQYAKDHSRAMARKGYLFHSTGDQLRNLLDGRRWSIAGENVGVGGTLESLEDAFMDSEAHRQNILRHEFLRAAVGVFREDGRLWVTVIFYG
jgi:uncharacterized protein YkwD